MSELTEEQIDCFAIGFANWLDKLSPTQRISLWSKSGEYRGIFSMDNEQLLEKYKKELQRKTNNPPTSQ